jgi:hypothetical protein
MWKRQQDKYEQHAPEMTGTGSWTARRLSPPIPTASEKEVLLYMIFDNDHIPCGKDNWTIRSNVAIFMGALYWNVGC